MSELRRAPQFPSGRCARRLCALPYGTGCRCPRGALPCTGGGSRQDGRGEGGRGKRAGCAVVRGGARRDAGADLLCLRCRTGLRRQYDGDLLCLLRQSEPPPAPFRRDAAPCGHHSVQKDEGGRRRRTQEVLPRAVAAPRCIQGREPHQGDPVNVRSVLAL